MIRTVLKGGLEYLTADCLQGVCHGFTTRLGGVSSGTLAGLNLGLSRGDRRENVLENYRILGRALGFSPESTVFTKQEHTDVIRTVTAADCGSGLFRPCDYVADGLVCGQPGVTLVCFSADCTPILLYDPVCRVVAAVHSGWRGTAAGIVRRAVEVMTEQFGCKSRDLRAAIGPCISVCCFETGPEVPEAMRRALGAAAEQAIFPEASGKWRVDLKRLNRIWLEQAGVEQIDVSEECTRCRPDRFFSHRAQGARRGSLAAVIGL